MLNPFWLQRLTVVKYRQAVTAVGKGLVAIETLDRWTNGRFLIVLWQLGRARLHRQDFLFLEHETSLLAWLAWLVNCFQGTGLVWLAVCVVGTCSRGSTLLLPVLLAQKFDCRGVSSGGGEIRETKRTNDSQVPQGSGLLSKLLQRSSVE